MEEIKTKKSLWSLLHRAEIRAGLYSTLCILGLLTLCIIKLIDDPISSPVTFGLVALELLLFVGLGVRFMPRWVDAWSGAPLRRDLVDQRGIRVFLIIFFTALGSRLLVFLLTWAVQHFAYQMPISIDMTLSYWYHGDATHYLDIATQWYVSDPMNPDSLRLVFFPLFPALVKLINLVVGNVLASGLILSTLCFSVGAYLLFRVAALDYGAQGGLRALKYLCILPAAFFFNAPMTESLFLLLSAACIFFTRKRNYLLAGLMGALASGTRMVGLILIVPVLFEMIQELIIRKKHGQKILIRGLKYSGCVALMLVGFAAYLVVNKAVSGEFFTFLEYQSSHWNQSPGFFLHTMRYQADYTLAWWASGSVTDVMGLWIPNILAILASLGIVMATAKRLRPSYVAFFIAYFVVSTGVSWLLSAPRYLVACFPLPLALASLTKNKIVDSAFTIACSIGFVLYLFAFVSDWIVF